MKATIKRKLNFQQNEITLMKYYQVCYVVRTEDNRKLEFKTQKEAIEFCKKEQLKTNN